MVIWLTPPGFHPDSSAAWMKSPGGTTADEPGSGQGATEAFGVDPPVVVLTAVDDGHRDLLAVPPRELLGAVDVDLVPAHAELGADALDDGPGVVAEVAAGA